jgi:hypothetical protein
MMRPVSVLFILVYHWIQSVPRIIVIDLVKVNLKVSYDRSTTWNWDELRVLYSNLTTPVIHFNKSIEFIDEVSEYRILLE